MWQRRAVGIASKINIPVFSGISSVCLTNNTFSILEDGGHKCSFTVEMRHVKRQGRGSWLPGVTRDPVEEPIGFSAFAVEARVSVEVTNPRRCLSNVDVM